MLLRVQGGGFQGLRLPAKHLKIGNLCGFRGAEVCAIYRF